MAITNDNSREEPREEEQQDSDFWTDEGARRFNEALDEGLLMPSPTVLSLTIPKIISRIRNANIAIRNSTTPTRRPSLQGIWN